jgi:hypothetical protein
MLAVVVALVVVALESLVELVAVEQVGLVAHLQIATDSVELRILVAVVVAVGNTLYRLEGQAVQGL